MSFISEDRRAFCKTPLYRVLNCAKAAKEEAGGHFRHDTGFDALLMTPAVAYYPTRNPDATLARRPTR
ncbi:MAG: hypothetical protein LBU11_07290, partial [Zoogloeaceae bacterium]|nr:hypothetical protein [Zoogloeaceae bacterium]